VTELYVVDAMSFAEAEARVTEEMSSYISGTFTVEDVKKAAYKEIFFSDKTEDDRWYKAKLDFITVDDKSEKQKRSRVTYLVQAYTLKKAVVSLEDMMSGSMVDYEACAVDATRIEDVFEYKKEKEG
jgi:hypothetical protein